MGLEKVLIARALFKAAIREFFGMRGYLEVDTPVLVRCPGTELHLEYFRSSWRDFSKEDHELWLRSSPELHMKQILASGLQRIFQISPCFRNSGELSPWHHPEFTMLEWYEVGISFPDYIEQTIELLRFSLEVMKKNQRGVEIPLVLPKDFTHISVFEAFKDFAGIDLIDGDQDLASKAIAKGVISVKPEEDFETAYFKTLIEKIEPELNKLQGVVFYDYPPSQAALSRVENGAAKRFEIYLNGVELCNGFNELLDPKENRLRVKETLVERKRLGKDSSAEDEDFYAALEKNIPPTCGNALGFDRYLALLLGAKDLDSSVGFRNQKPFVRRLF